MVGDLEAQRETAVENCPNQHRMEFNENAATPTRLQKFLHHAAKYEAKLSERTGL
jgi:hypothetical protein